MSDMTLLDLLDRLPSEIALLPALQGEPPYRALQVFQWVHQHRVEDFDRMTNLPKGLRDALARSARVSRLDPYQVIRSRDGSEKLLFAGPDGRTFPAVLMPSEDRVTLCVSSQVGCRMGCRFCLTGQGGFVRHLSAREILGQVHAAMRRLPEGSRVTNVVFMGMGEPLDNLPEVLRAVRVMTHREGLRVAPRRTTLSTVGLVERIPEVVASATGVSIALSLCATTDEVRNEVVPAARRYGNLQAVTEALAGLTLPHGHVYTIEYTLIAGVGDSLDDARRLSRMLARFPHKVNLIPFNPWPGSPFRRPDDGAVEAFRQFLEDRHHPVTVRRSRGQDIGAACGMLELASPAEATP
ncbi:MAG TPA: 23S rRNA (adenine(2503)-C(2))-methyltransferase RlmN [Myxococcota bacterium]|nr:23S rRNA (adenine(2503)-C(2))-methyltransferase RlmN [Myxococcota bacterium]HQK49842.1 23S rRNA (adenine(2503)-C(2))-methyltransferase RlmN [Myxococcota bacterium]